MIIATQIIILICLGYIVGAGIQAIRDRRPIKYYTLESTDGYTYEMAYATRDLAIQGAKEMAYSGTAYEHKVGGGRKVSFLW